MAEERSGSGSTGIVAIVAIVMLVLVGFLLFRGSLGGRGGGSAQPGFEGKVQIDVPKPGTPQR